MDPMTNYLEKMVPYRMQGPSHVIIDANKHGAEESNQVFVGPITRARAKCFKEQFNRLIKRI